VFLTYASMVSITLSAFSCLSVDGAAYWARDMRLRCWSRGHASRVLVLGVVGAVVLCVGVPLALVFLSRQRDASAPHQDAWERRVGFLFKVYRPSRRSWEALLCLQTVTLVAVNQFALQLGALYQLAAVMGVLVVTTTLWHVRRPFRSSALMAFYAAGMMCLQLTCLLMMMLLNGYTLGPNGRESIRGRGRDSVAVLMMLLNCAFVVACVAAMVYSSLGAAQAFGSSLRRSLVRAAGMAAAWARSARG
jgi:hypothetical protein